jgi:hypothetical protein
MSDAVRHVVVFSWKDGVTPEQIEGVSAALRRLSVVIPEIRDYRFGPDLGVNEGNADFVVVADFDSLDDYLVYRDHPDHRAVVNETIRPLLADRTAVQYQLA